MFRKYLLILGLIGCAVVLSAQDGANPGLGVSMGGGGGGGGVTPPDGNAYNSLVGNNTWAHTFDRGTIVASDPFQWTQTWNNAAVTFHGFVINQTRTAAGVSSRYFEVLKSGADLLFIDDNNGTTVNTALNVTGSYIQILNTATIFTQGRGLITFPSNDDIALGTSANAGPKLTFKVGLAPTLSAGCGTGATISGNNSVGRVTIGTTPGATCVLSFTEAFTTNAPHCDANNESTGVLVANVVPTTADVTLTGTFVSTNKVSYSCTGWQ